MKLNENYGDFLEKRRRLLKAWRYAGPSLLLAILGLVVFLKVRTPLLIDPYEVVSRLEAGSLEQTTLELMAVLLPITMILVCFVLVMLVVFIYAAFSNEKKYRQILQVTERDRST